ncbi:MAG: hypothetical protein IEMM0008_0323 [bacterium]|nr:MAG: hypothetical protein IEMM0008_0323 [bacterium]
MKTIIRTFVIFAVLAGIGIFGTLETGSAASKDKYLLADFDATWCATCKAWKASDPGLSDLKAKAEDLGVQVVVFEMTNKATRAKAARRAKKLGIQDIYEKYQPHTGFALLIKVSGDDAELVAIVSPKKQSYEEQVEAIKEAIR